MYCPDCQEEMIVLELDKVEVDYCISCQGIWLDEGELELLLDSVAENKKFIESFQVEKKSAEKKRKCPACRKKMDKVLINQSGSNKIEEESNQALSATAGKIIIDSCPRKHGLWFDHGELFKTLDLGGLPGNQKVYQLLKDLFIDSSSS